MPQGLPSGGTTHVGGFNQFGGNVAKTLDGVAHDRHGSKDHHGRHNRHVIDAKQHDDRDQVNEAGECLRRITDQQDPCGARRFAGGPYAQRQTDQPCNQNRDGDRVDGYHRPVPPA